MALLKSASDIILSEVAKRWSPPNELRGVKGGAQFKLAIDIRPNGMFGPPFAADAPWNPAAAVPDINAMEPQDPRRLALLTFYRAIRDIQPLTLPPRLALQLPLTVPVAFLLDDMP